MSSWKAQLKEIIQTTWVVGAEFTSSELYKFEDRFQDFHEKNRTIRDSIRHWMQKLRDEGYVAFVKRGRYRRLR